MNGTTIKLVDQSSIPKIDINNNADRPIIFAGFSSDKGTEDLQYIEGDEFFKQYGEISYDRHGQPLLQAANAINNGAILYAKRIVDSTSTLAGAMVYAKITTDDIKSFSKTRNVYWLNSEKTMAVDRRREFTLDYLLELADCKHGDGGIEPNTAPGADESAYTTAGNDTEKQKNVIKANKAIFTPYDLAQYNKLPENRFRQHEFCIMDFIRPLSQFDLKHYIGEDNLGKTDFEKNAELRKGILAEFKALVSGSTTEQYTSDSDHTTYDYSAKDTIKQLKIGFFTRTLDYVNGTEEFKKAAKLVGYNARKYYELLKDTSYTDNTQFNTDYVFPLFAITDVGRGKSAKSFRIEADVLTSTTSEAARYNLIILDEGKEVERLIFSFNPDELEGTENIFLSSVVKNMSKHVRCYADQEDVNKFFETITNKLNDTVDTNQLITVNEVKQIDIINCKTYRGDSFRALALDSDPAKTITATTRNLNGLDGIPLEGGYNGDYFGTAPIKCRKVAKNKFKDLANRLVTEDNNEYDERMVELYSGVFNDDIFNFDNTPIDLVIDADYSFETKRAIKQLCEFRQDVFYFMDMGFKVHDLLSLKRHKVLFKNLEGRSNAQYFQYYDIIDPYSRKQITVTIGYDLARLACVHFNNGRNLVCAGIANGWTISNVIPGTVNFIPKYKPGVDEQGELEDIRVNYGMFTNNVFTMASEYTSQDKYTQLSFINNMLSIQELIKDIRIECPKARYKFITGQDFEKYKSEVQTVIDKHNSKFATITIEFQQNAVYNANKIVYAVIKVSFKDFAQKEIFKIIALPIAAA